jgi:UDP-3-O-[3-hydroxymyristoyl] glucosamine N-acyltransferase
VGLPLKARAVAAALAARIVGDADRDLARAVHPAEARDPADLAVALTPDTLRALADTRAELVLVAEGSKIPEARFRTILFAPLSRATLSEATSMFSRRPAAAPGVHPTAVVAPDATIGADVSIGPFCVIGPGAAIGARSVLLSQATVSDGAVIGEDCLIFAGVRIGMACRVGDRVVIHHNASIGADGFSFLPAVPGAAEAARSGEKDAAGNGQRNPLLKIHSLGNVEIGDDVEIGALTAIDRGTLRPTRIGHGTKIDDLVMIGHNVQIGMDCMLCGQVALAGSVMIGDRAVLGGRVAVADHLTVGAGAVLGGGSLVGTNVPAGAVYLGVPAVPREEALDNLKLLRRVRRFLDAEAKNGQTAK